jgi:hypothetical protein
MEWLHAKIDKLEQKIQQDESKETDPSQRESLKEIIHELRGYVQQLTQLASQPAPSKFRNILPSLNLLFLSYFVQQLLL